MPDSSKRACPHCRKQVRVNGETGRLRRHRNTTYRNGTEVTAPCAGGDTPIEEGATR